MKTSQMLMGILLIFSPMAFGEDLCLTTYKQKGLSPGATLQAIQCYQNQSTSPHQQNQLSYLWFFHAEHEINAEDVQSLTTLERSFDLAKQNILSFGPFLDFEAYKKLDAADSKNLARALYMYGITLARISERKGVNEVMNQWPEIQKVMKMIMRLKNADLEYYGAYRTLAIANTRMPAPFGDKKIAQDYFELIIQKTAKRDSLSAFLNNNVFYAEFLFSQDQEEIACQELEKIAAVLDSEILEWAPEHIFESQSARGLAKEQFEQKCLPVQP